MGKWILTFLFGLAMFLAFARVFDARNLGQPSPEGRAEQVVEQYERQSGLAK